MLHYSAHSVHHCLLFQTWEEARALWERLLTLGPPHALVLMPDHVHLLTLHAGETEWRRVLYGYRAWRYQHRLRKGSPPAPGPILLPQEPPLRVADRQHLNRTTRYIHLNPCRGRLVADPLGWAFSTHRDRVGLAVPLACPLEADPYRFHGWVSADPSVDVQGTHLPNPIRDTSQATAGEIRHAVSSLLRVPVAELQRKSPARRLAVASLKALSRLSARAVAKAFGVAPSSVPRLTDVDSHEIALVARLLGDARFHDLKEGDLARTPSWQRYMRVIQAKRYQRFGNAFHT